MSDVLDINTSCDFEQDEEGDRVITQLKQSARKHKGRGLTDDRPSKYCKFQTPESKILPDEDKKKIWDVPPNQIIVQRKQKVLYVDADETVPHKSIEGWVIFVTGIHEEATEDDIHEKFSEYGTVKNMRINLDRRTGFLKGYALLEYGSFEEAFRTRENLQDEELLGCNLQVNWAFIKGPSKLLVSYK